MKKNHLKFMLIAVIGLTTLFSCTNGNIVIPKSEDTVLQESKKRKAIIIAGQSNTLYGVDFGKNPVPVGELKTNIKQLSRDASGNINVTQAGMTNINFSASNSIRTGYAYPLALKIEETLADDEELIIIPVAHGSSGVLNRWAPNGSLTLDLAAKIDYTVSVLDAEIIGAFWSQGEEDTKTTAVAQMYEFILSAIVAFVRDHAETAGQKNAQQIPFVTFDIVKAFLDNDASSYGLPADKLAVQTALENISQKIPYSANIDSTNLPADTENDEVHYDARQHIELANRYFDAFEIAKNNDALAPNSSFPKTLVFSHKYSGGSSNLFPSKWDALSVGASDSDALYSRLGDLWKYRKNGKYRLRLEIKPNGVSNLKTNQDLKAFRYILIRSNGLVDDYNLVGELRIYDADGNNMVGSVLDASNFTYTYDAGGEFESYKGEFLFDNSTSTGYGSVNKPRGDKWVIVDLGETVTASDIEIFERTPASTTHAIRINHLTILFSDDVNAFALSGQNLVQSLDEMKANSNILWRDLRDFNNTTKVSETLNGKMSVYEEHSSTPQDNLFLEWEQPYLPQSVIQMTSPASFIDGNTQYGVVGGTGFCGLRFFHEGNQTLLTMNTSNKWYMAVGLTTAFTNGIPIHDQAGGYSTEVKLYVL